ncbi:MAG: MerR family transcriptional regulator [Terracidiphilus sp.]|jgi:DNA-binding transcriptional MerR regulator
MPVWVILLTIPMATQLSQKRAHDHPSIPDRLYFKIGDVARICEVETYVLRFWESQFPQLKPNKSGTGQRLYRRRDVEVALEIKDLVHGQGYTLSGARQALEQASRRRASGPVGPKQEPLRESQSRLPLVGGEPAMCLDAVASAVGHARAELREIAAMLAAPTPRTPRRRPRIAAIPNNEGTLFPS